MLQREPVIVLLGGLGAIVLAILGALVGLEVLAWTPEQVGLVVAAVTAVTGVLIAMLRAAVVSPATDAERTEQAAARPSVPSYVADVDELAAQLAAALAREHPAG